MAADLPLPEQIWAHGWLLFDSEKMSKSRGNVVRPRPIVNALGIEPLRYYLLREIVFGQDGSFSYDALVTRYNSDLANGLGNLASRTLTMIERYFGGEIPKPAPEQGGETDAPSTAEFANEALTKVMHLYDRLGFSLALESIWEIVAMIDKYITVEKPWALAEKPEDRERLATVLYTAAEGLRIVTALAHPVLPQATQKIWSQLGQTEPLSGVQLDLLSWGQLKPGTKTGKPEGIFPRVDKSETIARIEAMEQEQNKAPETPAAAAASTPAGAGAAAAPAAAARDEDWHRGFRQSGDARRAGEDRRARGGRGQAAATAGRYRRRSAANRRGTGAGVQAGGSGGAQSGGGDEFAAAKTARRGIERHDCRGVACRMARPCWPVSWKMCPLGRG